MKKKKKHVLDVQFVTACISTALVLLLLGTVAFFVLTANSFSVYVRENLELSVLIHDGVQQTEVDNAVKRINAKPFIKELRHITKDEILRQQTASMGIDPTEFLGFNPYTASLEIKLKADYANADSILRIVDQLKHESIVREVSYPSELVNNINSNIRKVSIVLLTLALALLLISFALINNTIKLTIYSQRFLLHTMKLVGATYGFIRKPFLKKMLIVGIISASLACVFIGMCIVLLCHYEQYAVSIITQDIVLITYISVFVMGLVISIVCTYISVNKFLKMTAADLYRY